MFKKLGILSCAVLLACGLTACKQENKNTNPPAPAPAVEAPAPETAPTPAPAAPDHNVNPAAQTVAPDSQSAVTIVPANEDAAPASN